MAGLRPAPWLHPALCSPDCRGILICPHPVGLGGPCTQASPVFVGGGAALKSREQGCELAGSALTPFSFWGPAGKGQRAGAQTNADLGWGLQV